MDTFHDLKKVKFIFKFGISIFNFSSVDAFCFVYGIFPPEASNTKSTKELFNNKIVTEIKPLNNFYEAEKYHQNYYKNNSSAGYCRAVITPKVLKAKKELNKFYK